MVVSGSKPGSTLLQLDIDRVADRAERRVDEGFGLDLVRGLLEPDRVHQDSAEFGVFERNGRGEFRGFSGWDLHALARGPGEDAGLVDEKIVFQPVENRVDRIRILDVDDEIDFQVREIEIVRRDRGKRELAFLDRQPLLDRRATQQQDNGEQIYSLFHGKV